MKKIPDIMAILKAALPDLGVDNIKSMILEQIFGPVPAWSTISKPQVHDVKTATVGSCVICYANDPSIKSHSTKGVGSPVIALIKRSEKGPQGQDRFGVLGGYTNLGGDETVGEQPKDGAVRELKEEALNDKGVPIISPDPKRLHLIANGIDYRKPKLPVVWHAHTMELKTAELNLLKEHAAHLKNDDGYRQEVKKQSHNEVNDLLILPLADVLAMPRDSFTHPHEFDAVVKLSEQLEQRHILPAR